jgi:hypothetical protein
MNAPGCGGFIPTFAIVLLISDNPPGPGCDLAALDSEGDAPVAGNRNAPGPGAVARELVHAPTGRCAQALDVRSGDEKGQHVADALHEVAAQFA